MKQTRNAYATTMLSGLSESGFRIEYDGMKYPFFTNTAGLMHEAVSEFMESSHFVGGDSYQDVIYIERINTFGDITHTWEMDLVSMTHRKIVQPQYLQM